VRGSPAWPHRALARCWLFALLLALLAPSGAAAHASLVASDPAGEATLVAAPSAITLTFNEPVEPLAIRLLNAAGADAAIAQISRDGNRVIVMPAASIGEGAHVVSWRVISADGHPASGSLTFRVGESAAALPPVVVAANPERQAAIWIARWTIYLGLMAGAGGAFFLAWIAVPPALRSAARICAAAGTLGLAAIVLSLGLQGLDIDDLPMRALGDATVWIHGARGSFGQAAAVAAIALLLGLASLRARGFAAKLLSLGALAGVGLALAATGHAATAEPRAVMVAALVLHGCAVAFWVGALVPLGVALGTGQGAVTLQRFSRAIPFAVAVMVAAGIILAVVQVERLGALWTTGYGLVLSGKIALVLLLLAIGLRNRRSLTPQVIAGSAKGRQAMRRAIRTEIIVVVAILGAVGLWRFTPPPRAQIAAVDSLFTHLHGERAMANVTIVPGRAGPLDIDIQISTPAEAPLAAQALTVTLASPALGIGPASAPAQPVGEGQWRVRMSAPLPGQWTLTLGILVSDFDRIILEAPITVR
jgi:copper transport protein